MKPATMLSHAILLFAAVGCSDKKEDAKPIATTQVAFGADFHRSAKAKVVLEKDTVTVENVEVGDPKVTHGKAEQALDCPAAPPKEGTVLEVKLTDDNKLSIKDPKKPEFSFLFTRVGDAGEDKYTGKWLQRKKKSEIESREYELSIEKESDKIYEVSWVKKCTKHGVSIEHKGKFKTERPDDRGRD